MITAASRDRSMPFRQFVPWGVLRVLRGSALDSQPRRDLPRDGPPSGALGVGVALSARLRGSALKRQPLLRHDLGPLRADKAPRAALLHVDVRIAALHGR